MYVFIERPKSMDIYGFMQFKKNVTMTGTIKFLLFTKDIYLEGIFRTVRFLGKADFWGNVLRYLERKSDFGRRSIIAGFF